MTEFREQFWPGQSAPDFLMPGTPGTRVTFYEQHCGRPTVLVFVPRRRRRTRAGRSPGTGRMSW
jgi:peroxiredoxin